MSKLTQGTELFFIDPDSLQVVKVGAISQFNPGGSPADQIEDTDLDATAKTYKKGLRTPGQASVTIFADPSRADHIRLHELANEEADRSIKWAIGWSGDKTPPDVDSDGEFSLPVTRAWTLFDGYVSDFPFDFSVNTVVSTALTIQRSGTGLWVPVGGIS